MLRTAALRVRLRLTPPLSMTQQGALFCALVRCFCDGVTCHPHPPCTTVPLPPLGKAMWRASSLTSPAQILRSGRPSLEDDSGDGAFASVVSFLLRCLFPPVILERSRRRSEESKAEWKEASLTSRSDPSVG